MNRLRLPYGSWWRLRGPHPEGGLASLELVLMSIPLLAVITFIVLGGRLVGAQETLDGIAHYAARQAATARSADDAIAVAQQVAAQDLADSELDCATTGVEVEAGEFHPGGAVRVRVSCGVRLGDLTPLPVPGTKTMAAASAAVVDVFRGTS